jgi:hypothetical protein
MSTELFPSNGRCTFACFYMPQYVENRIQQLSNDHVTALQFDDEAPCNIFATGKQNLGTYKRGRDDLRH